MQSRRWAPCGERPATCRRKRSLRLALGPLVLGVVIAVAGGITTAIWAGVGLVGVSGVLLLGWSSIPARDRP